MLARLDDDNDKDNNQDNDNNKRTSKLCFPSIAQLLSKLWWPNFWAILNGIITIRVE
jgi:hypothetical protein